ncbi:DUF1345 domain-containing protein [Novosphingobium flavum]|uniref:DUF1345 domain-containing protein n=1 Tax=Novosphingobium flavum TaxID=1778672 RepID=A0A7X1KL09_9SPHN|nr:DUF1345 domain-containing protein [Novosphingobium flavum]MBC2665096.1 DUF1345 domain-containing protein [Novosphingobium flavum]
MKNAAVKPRHPLRVAIGRKIAPLRFLAFMVLFPAAVWAHHHLFAAAPWTRSLALGFDLAAAVFLVSLIPLWLENAAEPIRARADANAANRWMVLAVSTLLTVIVMSAIAGELPTAKRGDAFAIFELVATLLLIWLFANAVYALHYAHDFYTAHPEQKDADCGGIDFPGTPEPSYADFAYFAFTLGMTFQTSDVAVTATRIRMVALFHSFGAFLFNIGVIAFTINALGGS